MRRSMVAGGVIAVVLGIVAIRALVGSTPHATVASTAHPAVAPIVSDRPDSVVMEMEYRRASSDSLRRAAADSDFSVAYRNVARILGQEESDSSLLYAALRQAYALKGTLSRERSLVEASYHAYISHDTAALIQTLREGVDRYPDEASKAAGWLTGLLYAQGQIPEALTFAYRYARIGSPSANFFVGWIPVAIEVGSIDSAGIMIERFAEDHPRDDRIVSLRVQRYATMGRGDSAAIVLERALATTLDSAERMDLFYDLADLSRRRGRLEESMRHYADAIRLTLATGAARDTGAIPLTRRLEARTLDRHAYISLSILHDTAAAVAFQDRALAIWPANWRWPSADRYFGAAYYYAQGGRTRPAAEYLHRWEAAVPESTRTRNEASASTLALIALVEGRVPDAIAHWRVAQKSCRSCYLDWFATAFDAAGETDSAIVYLERAIKRHGEFGLEAQATQYETLGRLYDRRGDPRKAAAAYQRVIDFWKDADPVLQARVQTARDYVAKVKR